MRAISIHIRFVLWDHVRWEVGIVDEDEIRVNLQSLCHKFQKYTSETWLVLTWVPICWNKIYDVIIMVRMISFCETYFVNTTNSIYFFSSLFYRLSPSDNHANPIWNEFIFCKNEPNRSSRSCLLRGSWWRWNSCEFLRSH